MTDVSRTNLSLTSGSSTYKLDKYRWIIIAIFGLYCMANFFLTLQFAVIANITERFYHTSISGANASTLVFMGSFIIFCIPVGQFIEKYDLKPIAVVSTGLTAFGNILKLFALSADRYYLVIISQLLCGIGQVFMVGVPPKVAGIWFGAEEVSLACGIGIMGCQFGSAIGSLIPTILVPNVHNVYEIKEGFLNLFVLDNILSSTAFILVLIFFRSKPESPPSQAQAAIDSELTDTQLSYWENFRECSKNKDYLLVTFCTSMTWGTWCAMGIMINQMYLHYFPDDIHDLGIVLMMSLFAGGVSGSLIFGFILDKTHEFKKVSFCLFFCNCVFWTILTICFHQRFIMGANIMFILNGFCGGSLLVPSFEYVTEVIYPIPGEFGATLLNACVYLVAITSTIFLEYIFTTIGFLAGQIIVALTFGISACTCLLISSNFKRRNVNLQDTQIQTYGTTLSRD